MMKMEMKRMDLSCVMTRVRMSNSHEAYSRGSSIHVHHHKDDIVRIHH